MSKPTLTKKKIGALQSQLNKIDREVNDWQSRSLHRLGMNYRMNLLKTSFSLEDTIDRMLKRHLGIDEEKKVPLPLDQKIWFLEVIGSVTKEDRSIFKAFQELRNRAIHDAEATSVVRCFEKAPTATQVIKQLLKSSPHGKLAHDLKDPQKARKYEIGLNLLLIEVMDRSATVIAKANERVQQRMMNVYHERFLKASLEAMFIPFQNSMRDLAKDKSRTYTAKEAAEVLSSTATALHKQQKNIHKRITLELVDPDGVVLGLEALLDA